MRILITGASGFIGSSLVEELRSRGHELICCVHRSRPSTDSQMKTLQVDYMNDVHVADWLPRLRDVEVVINTVGILRDSRSASLEALHYLAPKALFEACEQSGVRRVIQISALGADETATSQYHLTKKAADDVLRNSQLDWTIVQPSVVFGVRGASTQLFLRLASMPVVPLVGSGDAQLQPIHIGDLMALVTKLVDHQEGIREVIPAVGPKAVSLRELLSAYRDKMGLGMTVMLPVPIPLMRISAWIGDTTHVGSLSTETLEMLLTGNTAPSDTTTNLLGHSPRAVAEFIASDMASPLKMQAIWSWLRPLFLATLALMWVTAGLVSWFYASEYGLILLADFGMSPSVAKVAFASSCVLNVIIGMTTLIVPKRPVWLLQLGVVFFYSVALTYVAPHLWLDPFGSLVKNLPVAVVMIGMLAVES